LLSSFFKSVNPIVLRFRGCQTIGYNGYGFVQDGHLYSVAGLAGYR
jgi:hypothetical protein